MLDANYRENIVGTRAQISLRNGTFHLRFYIGNGHYKTESLKTSVLDDARRQARLVVAQYEYRLSEGLPLHHRTLNQVLDEYLALRRRGRVNDQNPETAGGAGLRTAEGMWVQIQRVSPFLRTYAGTYSVERIGDGMLARYVEWRKDYYHRMADEDRPARIRLNPADKTLQWELTYFRMVLKFAKRQGYRGTVVMPDYTFTAKTKIVRPPFTDTDYRTLRSALRDWVLASAGTRNAHTSQLLNDYVAILANSGLRVGEANKLTWAGVEAFTDGKGRKNYKLAVTGKTGRRTVIPRRAVVGYFDRIRSRAATLAPADPVFRMPSGCPVKTMRYAFTDLLKRGGLERNALGERYSLYSLRHFYAVRALRRRVDVYMLARNMGTSVQIIQDYYGRRVTAEMGGEQLGD